VPSAESCDVPKHWAKLYGIHLSQRFNPLSWRYVVSNFLNLSLSAKFVAHYGVLGTLVKFRITGLDCGRVGRLQQQEDD
jgi:hypothetical protein